MCVYPASSCFSQIDTHTYTRTRAHIHKHTHTRSGRAEQEGGREGGREEGRKGDLYIAAYFIVSMSTDLVYEVCVCQHLHHRALAEPLVGPHAKR
jgi:hypothetical protein